MCAECAVNSSQGGEGHNAFANEGCVLCGEAIMIDTMKGKISQRCAEVIWFKANQVQVCVIQLKVIAGVGLQPFGSSDDSL
jgi:predicted nucleic acid-binding Zn ribbon protein